MFFLNKLTTTKNFPNIQSKLALSEASNIKQVAGSARFFVLPFQEEN